MTSILKNKVLLSLQTICVISLFGLFSTPAEAQQALALSVSPTLFEMSAVPGQSWKSSVKVINSNRYPITIFANSVNFEPLGEGGQGRFFPVFNNEQEGTTLAEWVSLEQTEITIPAEQSKEVSFVVNVPDNAPPGGHFAAILIGTQPPVAEEGSMQVRTSQIVSSLFFLRVEGEVLESGLVRSFSTTDSFVERPKATFELRFENKGNVHLRPQGSIEIFNMWGTERGVIPINQQTHFGNVLPDSIRRFEFTWSGEQSITDFGRYKAIVSLAYGNNVRKFASQTTYFWVVPLKAGLLTLSGIFLIILFVRWSIKAYVRRMLALSGVPLQPRERASGPVAQSDDVKVTAYRTVSAPVRSGLKDFKERVLSVERGQNVARAIWGFLQAYRAFFLALFGLGVIALLVTLYLAEVNSDRSFEVTIENSGVSIDLNSEELYLQELLGAGALQTQNASSTKIRVINVSGVTGAAAFWAQRLDRDGFKIEGVGVEAGRVDRRSVVVFPTSLQSEAVIISEKLGNALLSADPGVNKSEEVISVYVGKDRAPE